VLSLLAGGGVVVGQTPAADDGLNHAALVVRYGDGRTTYAYVPFEDASISGLDLLRRGLGAGEVPLVTVGFGGLGEGVCRIADTGCPAADCRRRVCQGPNPDAPYWRYFRQAAPGDWRPVPLGASGSEVADGDVDAWSWTGGDAGLPPLTITDVARLAGAPATGEASEPVARTVGAEPATPAASAETGWPAYAGAAGILAAIAAGALVAARRRATEPAA